MEGYPGKLPADLNYGYTSSSQPLASTNLPPPPPCSITTPPTYMPHPINQTENEAGTSLQEEQREGSNTGRKKKKKHKSGDDSNAKATIMSEEELVDAAIPILPENQGGVGVEELVVPSTLSPPSGTLVGGQYLLNNTLLDHILSQKKMQILQSPEVIEYLNKQMSKK